MAMEADQEQQFFEDQKQEVVQQPQQSGVSFLSKIQEKATAKAVVLIIFGGLILLGLIVTIIEQVAPPKTTNQPQQEAFTPMEVEKKPGRMAWLFYDDKNKNNVFDYKETLFNDISVSIRRAGDTQTLRTVPSGADGAVVIDGLAEGDYEIQYVNYELENKETVEDFKRLNYYQLVEPGKQNLEFLPSEWKLISLGKEGYSVKVGVKRYEPSNILVLASGEGVSFYDPIRDRVIGQSNLNEPGKHEFTVQGNELFYVKLADRQVKKYSYSSQVAAAVIEPVYDIDVANYKLSEAGNLVVYKLDNELRFWGKDEQCREGAIILDGERLDVKANPELKVSFWDNKRFIFLGKGQETAWRLYEAQCQEIKPLNLEVEPTSFGFLEEQVLFYSDGSGSYFYNLKDGTKVKYEALGVNAQAIISADKKYVAAKVGDNWIVVDYPAVKQSGVEKHYVIPAGGEITFSGDEILVNKSKVCQSDGDCGEIERVSLQGNGAWSSVEKIDIKDVAVEKILGEIRL